MARGTASYVARLLLVVALLVLSTLTVARAQPPRRRFGPRLPLPPRPPGLRSLPRRRQETAGNDDLRAAAADDTASLSSSPSTALPPVDAAEHQEPAVSAGAQGAFCGDNASSSPTLTSPDPVVGGGFGASAALDSEGRVLVVGAPGEGLDPSLAAAAPQGGYAPAGAGGAYYSARQGSCRWSSPRYLAPPPPPGAGASPPTSSSPPPLGAVAFGSAVAASGDGETLLVGATLLRRPERAGSGYVRPVVYVADAATGDVVRQEVGEGAEALLAQRDAGALAAAVLAGDARSAVAHGAAAPVAVDAGVMASAVFSDVASVFVGSAGGSGSGSGSGGFSRAATGLPLELPASLAGGLPLQLTSGLRLSLSGDGGAAAASITALYAPSTARGVKLGAAGLLVGAVQVFSRAGGGGFSLLQRVEAPASAGALSSPTMLWGAAHALSDDGRALAVLAVAPSGGRDAVFVFRRADASAPFGDDAAEKVELTPGEQASPSVALSADGGALAVGLLSGRALLMQRAAGGGGDGGSSWARRCAFEAGSGAVEVRLPASGEAGSALRLVAASAGGGAPARVFEVRGGASCPSGAARELGGGAASSASAPSALAVGGRYAVVGAPGASLDERLPASGGLFSYVLA